ncbi:MAG: replication initiation protein [Saprospiraceae bacterium]|nr:replication initiation protein [Saprospiraceae bacterium]
MEIEDVKPPVVLADSEHIFVQSNDFIRAKYKENMSFWEFMIFGKMCTMIAPEDEDFKEYQIFVKDLIGLLGITDGGGVYKYVLEAASRLLDKRIIVSYKDDTGRRMVLETNLVAGFSKPEKLLKNEPVFINITFHPHLKPFLLQLQRDFTKVDLRNYKFLRTGTSIRLYHLLKQYFGRRQYNVEVPLAELKEMLGVANKYDLYGHFKAAVLDEAQKRLIETTDISFVYQEVKVGRKVAAIVFHIKENAAGHSMVENLSRMDPIILPKNSTSFSKKLTYTPTIPPNAGAKEITTKTVKTTEITTETLSLTADIQALAVQTWHVSAKMWKSLVTTYDESALRQAVTVTQKALEAGKVKDAAGFFVQAVRNGYVDTEGVKVAKQKQQKVTVEAQKTVEVNQRSLIEAKRKADFEKEKKAIFQMLEEDIELVDAVAKRLHGGILQSSYDDTKSFDDNLQNPLLLAAVMNIVKEITGKV